MGDLEKIEENALLSRWSAWLPRAPQQVGAMHESDAELVDLGDGRLLALTVDAIDEEIHAGLYRDPAVAGYTAVTASLSDLAAVGADPVGVLLCVTLPQAGRDAVQEALARGAAAACRDAGTFVLGGDTNHGEALRISCTAAGTVGRADLRTRVGAAPGEIVYASGPLGLGAALGAAALLGVGPEVASVSDWRPRARVAEGRALRRLATACMDTSDGLVATLDQLARVNGLAIRIETPLEALLAEPARRVVRHLGLPPFVPLAVVHGEYELVFTVPESRVAELERVPGWSPLRVGRTEPGAGLWVGDRPVDGAAVRNLSLASGVGAYVGALASLAVRGGY